MQKLFVLACVLLLLTITGCASQRADRTSSGKAAYGVATVSRTGKTGKVKKKKRWKIFKSKAGKKSAPEYRKKDPWAG